MQGECKEGSLCKEVKFCPLSHPRLCRRILIEGSCGHGQKCAYNHKIRQNKYNTEIETLNVKNLKAEIDIMKNTIKSLICIKQEGKQLQKDISRKTQISGRRVIGGI